jgi:hypothetical protein
MSADTSLSLLEEALTAQIGGEKKDLRSISEAAEFRKKNNFPLNRTHNPGIQTSRAATSDSPP